MSKSNRFALMLLVLVGQIADALSTRAGLKLGMVEGNTIVANLIEEHGIAALLPIKIALGLILCAIFARKTGWLLFWAISFNAVAVWNLIQIIRITGA